MFTQQCLVRLERELVRHIFRSRVYQRHRSSVTTLQERETQCLHVESNDPSSETVLPFHAMPGPKSLPVLGTRWMYVPGGPLYGMPFYDKMCKLRRLHGDIIREEVVPGFSIVHIFKPEDYETVYRNDGKYPIRNSFFMLQRYNTKYNNGVQGIINSHGESWHRLRRQVQQKMMKPNAVTAYFEEQGKVADDFISYLRTQRNENDVTDDLMQHLYKFSLESIGVVCFNKRIGALDEDAGPNSDAGKFITAVSDILYATHSELQGLRLFMYFDTPKFKRFIKAQDTIRKVSLSHAQDALSRLTKDRGKEIDGERGDLIPYLMTKTDLTEDEVMTVVAEFFFGGVDTTSHMLGFILYNLCKYPDVMDKLLEEIDTVLPDRRSPTEYDIPKMSYMRAVMKESLRILPVAPGNGRTTTRDIVLSGYSVPKGTFLALHHDITGHEEERFSEPDQMKPERWLRSDSSQCSSHPFTMMPFGFGTRQCVGKRFAEQEVALGLIKILQHFDVEYCHTSDLKYDMHVINTPTTPLRFRLSDRNG